MSKVHYIPEGYNSVTPYLVIKGAAKAIEYYKNVFDAKEVFRMDGPDGKVGHAELQIGNSRIMLADENTAMGNRSAETIGGSPVSLYIYMPDSDAVVEKAAAKGAKILKPVQDQFYGDRSGFIQVSGEAALVLVNCGHDYIGISSVSTLKRLTLTPRKTPEKLLMVLVVPSERRTRRSAE